MSEKKQSVSLKNSIIFRSLLMLILAITTIMVVSGSFFIYFQKEALEKSVFEKNSNDLKQVMLSIEQEFDQFGNQLSLLSKTTSVQQMDSIISASYLKSFDVASLFKIGELVSLYNRHNQLICDNSMNESVLPHKSFTDFGLVTPHRPYSTEWYWEDFIPNKFFAITVGDRALANGTLAANFSFRRIWHKYTSYKVGEDGFLIAFDDKNRLLMYPDLQKILDQHLEASDLGLKDFSSKTYSIEKPTFITLNGKEYLATYLYNARYQIGLLSLQSRAEIQSLISAVALGMLFLLGLTILASVLIILWLFKHFAFPLRHIIEHINHIAKGNFDSDPLPENKRNNELGILTRSFNQMQAIIQKQIQDLNKHKQHLEFEVVERTRELEDAKNQLDLISRTDELTKLPNRRDVREKIQLEASRAERTHRDFCFIFIDIDKFKDINDTFGHHCGDIVLKGVADIIRNHLRKYDYVARWGGEEFLVVLPETELQGAAIVAERFRKKVSQMKVEYSDTIISVTITLGVALYDSKLGVDRSIQLSDQALYKGKENGRNQVVVWDPKDTTEEAYQLAAIEQAQLHSSCPVPPLEKKVKPKKPSKKPSKKPGNKSETK